MEADLRITLAKEAPLRVGRVVVDPAARTVIGADGQSERLEPRVMQVLVQLARAAGGVVSRDDLIGCCWEGRIVGDDSINRVISRLRKASAERDGGFTIETIPRVGYRLVGEIAPITHPEPAGSEATPALALIRGFDSRRRRFWAMLAVVGALATVAMGGLAAEAVRARAAARAGRADAEQLVEFMLGDLRKRLDAVGRLDVLDSVGAETMRYYNRQPLDSLNADELARRAKALRLVGELREQRGDFATAQSAFERAAASTAELMARDPGNGQRVFDHMQSVFALGAVAQWQGDIPRETRSFETYARLADRLVKIDPHRDDWQAEYAYSRHNRGTVEYDRRQVEAARQDFAQAAHVFNILRHKHPDNAEYANVFAEANAWLADTRQMTGNSSGALEARLIEAAIYRPKIMSYPLNMVALQKLAWSEHAQGEIAHDLGDLQGAIAHLRTAQSMIRNGLRAEPHNVVTMQKAVPIQYDFAFVSDEAGDRSGATAAITAARQCANALTARDGSTPIWRQLAARTDLVRAELAWKAGNVELAKWLATPASETLGTGASHADLGEGSLWRARALLLLARLDPKTAPTRWRAVVAVLSPLRPNLKMGEACALNQAFSGLGRSSGSTGLRGVSYPPAAKRSGCEHWPWIYA